MKALLLKNGSVMVDERNHFNLDEFKRIVVMLGLDIACHGKIEKLTFVGKNDEYNFRLAGPGDFTIQVTESQLLKVACPSKITIPPPFEDHLSTHPVC